MTRLRTLLILSALCTLCTFCSDRAPATPPHRLPDSLSGFRAGPLTVDPRFERRTYTRGAAQVTVTLGALRMSETEYAQWVRTSVAEFPQAAIDCPDGEVNGFYQCDAPPRQQRCDLLVQLRSGWHLEIRGDAASTRSDVDAVARALPLRALCVRGAP